MKQVLKSEGIRKNSWISWRSILAGTLVALLSYAILISLGFAIGGLSLTWISLDGLEGFSVFAGIWLSLCIIISLFVGAYVSTRSGFAASPRLGSIQALTTAAVFFFVMSIPLSIGIGAVGKGVGNLMSMSFENADRILSQAPVQSVLEESMRGLKLERPMDEIVKGMATRALQGRFEAAKDYLIANSNLTENAAQSRMAQLETRFQVAMEEAQDKIGAIISAAAWMSFILLVLGTASAILGGVMAAKANARRPLVEKDYNIDSQGVRLAS